MTVTLLCDTNHIVCFVMDTETRENADSKGGRNFLQVLGNACRRDTPSSETSR